MPVYLVRTLLVREVGAVRETDGAQVVGQVGPDLAHVERFADPLETSPHSARTGQSMRLCRSAWWPSPATM